MTIQQMKSLQIGDVLFDAKLSNRTRDTVTCQVVEVLEDGLSVGGYDRGSSLYDDVIPWSEAAFFGLIDEDRIKEPGYLPGHSNSNRLARRRR